MSSSLADDLLKSRSVSELRSLVFSLQSDANEKKAELQSMVGSQYQEFLQSADRIATMHSESVDIVQSLERLQQQLCRSVQSAGYVVQSRQGKVGSGTSVLGTQTSADALCQGKPPINLRIHQKSSPPFHFPPYPGLRPSNVWDALNSGDVLGAGELVLRAHTLLHPPSSPSLEEGGVARSWSLSSAQLRDLRSVDFLLQVSISIPKLIPISIPIPIRMSDGKAGRQAALSPAHPHPHPLL
ncbi:hypothetical protein EON64_18380, partial [archaeon]